MEWVVIFLISALVMGLEAINTAIEQLCDLYSTEANERIKKIKNAYRTVYMSGKPLSEAKTELQAMAVESDDVRQMLDFIEASTRGIVR